MNTKKPVFFRYIFAVIILLLALHGCKKDDMTVGKVEISFVNHPGDLLVDIYPAENTNVAVFFNLTTDSKGILLKNLNAGNYTIRAFSDSAYPTVYDTPGFQIQVGVTTRITFDSNNVAHLQ